MINNQNLKLIECYRCKFRRGNLYKLQLRLGSKLQLGRLSYFLKLLQRDNSTLHHIMLEMKPVKLGQVQCINNLQDNQYSHRLKLHLYLGYMYQLDIVNQ